MAEAQVFGSEYALPRDIEISNIEASMGPYDKKLWNLGATIEEKYNLIKRLGLQKDATMEGYRMGYITLSDNSSNTPDADSGAIIDAETGKKFDFRTTNIDNYDAVDYWKDVYGDASKPEGSWNKRRSQPRMVAEMVGKDVKDLTPEDFLNVKNYQHEEWVGALTNPNHIFQKYDRNRQYTGVPFTKDTRIPVMYKVNGTDHFNRGLVDLINPDNGKPVTFDAMQNPYLNVTNMPYIKGDKSEQTFDVFRALDTPENRKRLEEFSSQKGKDFVKSVNKANDHLPMDYTAKASEYIKRYEEGTSLFQQLIDKFSFVGTRASESFSDVVDRWSRHIGDSSNAEKRYIKDLATKNSVNLYDSFINSDTARQLIYQDTQKKAQEAIEEAQKAYNEDRTLEAGWHYLRALGHSISVLPETLGDSAAQTTLGLGAQAAGALAGAKAGAIIGSTGGPIGTAVGGLIGALSGVVLGGVAIATDETFSTMDEYARNNDGKTMSADKIAATFGEHFVAAVPEVILQKIGLGKALGKTPIAKVLFGAEGKYANKINTGKLIAGSAVGEAGQEWLQNTVTAYNAQKEEGKRGFLEVGSDPEQIYGAMAGFLMGGALSGAASGLNAAVNVGKNKRLKAAIEKENDKLDNYTVTGEKADLTVSNDVINRTKQITGEGVTTLEDRKKLIESIEDEASTPGINGRAVATLWNKRQQLLHKWVQETLAEKDETVRTANQDALFKALGMTREEYFSQEVYHSNYNGRGTLETHGKLVTSETREKAAEALKEEGKALGLSEEVIKKTMENVSSEVRYGPYGYTTYANRINQANKDLDEANKTGASNEEANKIVNELTNSIRSVIGLYGNQVSKLQDFVENIESIARQEKKNSKFNYRSGDGSFNIIGSHIANNRYTPNSTYSVYGVINNILKDLDDMGKVLDAQPNQQFVQDLISQYDSTQFRGDPKYARPYQNKKAIESYKTRLRNAIATIQANTKKEYNTKPEGLLSGFSKRGKEVSKAEALGMLQRLAVGTTDDSVATDFTQRLRDFLNKTNIEEFKKAIKERYSTKPEWEKKALDKLTDILELDDANAREIAERQAKRTDTINKINEALKKYDDAFINSITSLKDAEQNKKIEDAGRAIRYLIKEFAEVTSHSEEDNGLETSLGEVLNKLRDRYRELADKEVQEALKGLQTKANDLLAKYNTAFIRANKTNEQAIVDASTEIREFLNELEDAKQTTIPEYGKLQKVRDKLVAVYKKINNKPKPAETTTSDAITSFRGEFDFLSNFYTVDSLRLPNENLVYSSVEAAFQAAKATSMKARKPFTSMTPSAAKKAGRVLKNIRKDWDKAKLGIMEDLLRQKFSNPDLKKRLLATGNRELIEGNTWGDTFWGVDSKKGGDNHLGKLLMKIRSELQKQDTSTSESKPADTTSESYPTITVTVNGKPREQYIDAATAKKVEDSFVSELNFEHPVETTVVHATKSGYGTTSHEIDNHTYYIYGGRPSPLGNPYEMGKDESKRQRVIDDCWKDVEWLNTVYKTLQWVQKNPQYTKVIFGCWCAPKPCHLDKLPQLVNAINTKNTPKPASTTEPTSTTEAKNYTLHSGGAVGSDTIWGEIGAEYGLGKAKHYYIGESNKYNAPNGNYRIDEKYSKEEFDEFSEEADKALNRANKTLERVVSTKLNVRRLLRRNYLQVRSADAVFAIGELTTSKHGNPVVDGGTGWAVQMAIDMGKPVYVFNQSDGKWYSYDNQFGNFVEWDTPTLTKNFAGVGTREITDAGIQAIRDVYEKTFGKPEAKPQESQQSGQPQTSISITPALSKNIDKALGELDVPFTSLKRVKTLLTWLNKNVNSLTRDQISFILSNIETTTNNLDHVSEFERMSQDKQSEFRDFLDAMSNTFDSALSSAPQTTSESQTTPSSQSDTANNKGESTNPPSVTPNPSPSTSENKPSTSNRSDSETQPTVKALAEKYYNSLKNSGLSDQQAKVAAAIFMNGAKSLAKAFGIAPEVYLSSKFTGFEKMTQKEFDEKFKDVLYQSAWHGSPYNFDAFSTKSVGEGEGLQFHGWGLYFGKLKDIGENYRSKLSMLHSFTYDGEKIYGTKWHMLLGDFIHRGTEYSSNEELQKDLQNFINDRIQQAQQRIKDYQLAFNMLTAKGFSIIKLKKLQERFDNRTLRNRKIKLIVRNLAKSLIFDKKSFDETKQGVLNDIQREKDLIQELKSVETNKVAYDNSNGQLFKVSIPENDVLLNENLLFNEQPKVVQKALLKLLPNTSETELINSRLSGYKLYAEVSKKLGSDKAASLALNKQGVKGIVYREWGENDGFVIFDDRAIKIVEKYYQSKKGQPAKGATAFSNGMTTIALFENGDVSTALHESAHFFLDELQKVASLDSAPDWVRKAWEAVQNEYKPNIAKAKDWVRVHERFARDFEAYMREGKAPREELQGLFDACKQWLKEIYKTIKSLLGKNKLSPEIRSVFDSLLSEHEFEKAPVMDATGRVQISPSIQTVTDSKGNEIGQTVATPTVASPITAILDPLQNNSFNTFKKLLGINLDHQLKLAEHPDSVIPVDTNAYAGVLNETVEVNLTRASGTVEYTREVSGEKKRMRKTVSQPGIEETLTFRELLDRLSMSLAKNDPNVKWLGTSKGVKGWKSPFNAEGVFKSYIKDIHYAFLYDIKQNSDGTISVTMPEVMKQLIDFSVKEYFSSRLFGNELSTRYLTDEQLARIFGENSETITSRRKQEFREFISEYGVPLAMYADSLGTLILQNAGITQNKEVCLENTKEKLAVGLGMFALDYANALGLITMKDFNPAEEKNLIRDEETGKVRSKYPNIKFASKLLGLKEDVDTEEDSDADVIPPQALLNAGTMTCIRMNRYNEERVNKLTEGFNDVVDEKTQEVLQQGIISAIKPDEGSHIDRNVIHSNKEDRTRQVDRRSERVKEVHNGEGISTVGKVPSEIIDDLSKVEYGINTRLADLLEDKATRDHVARHLGFLTEEEIEKLPFFARDGARGKNKEILDQIDGIVRVNREDKYRRTLVEDDPRMLLPRDGGLFFDWFFSRNGRYFIDSSDINPQTKKLQRFFIMPLSILRDFDINNKDHMQLEAFAIAQAFDNIKRSNEEILEIGEKVNALTLEELQTLQKDFIEKSEKEFKDMYGSDGLVKALGLNGVENFAQCLNVIDHLITKKKADGKPFKTWLAVENDATTSGYAIRFLNMPLSYRYDLMAKTGILVGDQIDKYGDKSIHELKALKGFEDLYETVAGRVSEGISDLSVVTPQGEFDPEQDERITGIFDKHLYGWAMKTETHNAAMSNIAGQIANLWNIIYVTLPKANEDGSISKALRLLMKYPTMIFGYAGGIKGITELMATSIREDYAIAYNKYYDDVVAAGGIDKYLANNTTKEGNEYVKAVFNLFEELDKVLIPRGKGEDRVTTIIEALRKKNLNEIYFKFKSGKEQRIMSFEKLFYNLLRPTYGSLVQESLSDNFAEHMEWNEDMANSFIAVFQLFKNEYDKRVDEARKTKPNRLLTVKEKEDILFALQDIWPTLGTAYGDTKEDGLMTLMKTQRKYHGAGANTSQVQNVKSSTFLGHNLDSNTREFIHGFVNKSSQANIRDWVTSDRAGAVVPIHWTDGAIMSVVLQIGLRLGILPVHDAYVMSALISNEITKEANEATLMINKDYDIMGTIRDRFFNVLKNNLLLKYDDWTDKEKETIKNISDISNLLYAAGTKQLPFTSKLKTRIRELMDTPIKSNKNPKEAMMILPKGASKKVKATYGLLLRNILNSSLAVATNRRALYKQRMVIGNVDGENARYYYSPNGENDAEIVSVVNSVSNWGSGEDTSKRVDESGTGTEEDSTVVDELGENTIGRLNQVIDFMIENYKSVAKILTPIRDDMNKAMEAFIGNPDMRTTNSSVTEFMENIGDIENDVKFIIAIANTAAGHYVLSSDKVYNQIVSRVVKKWNTVNKASENTTKKPEQVSTEKKSKEQTHSSNYRGYQTNANINDTLDRAVTDSTARADLLTDIDDMCRKDGHMTCSTSHMSRLKTLLTAIRPNNVKEMFVRLMKDGKIPSGMYNAGELSRVGDNYVIQLSMDDRTSSTALDPITRQSVYSSMSMAEIYAHECVHAGIGFAITQHINDPTKFHSEVHQLLELQKAGMKVITPEDFMPLVYDKSLEPLYREHAQKTWDYIFNNPNTKGLVGLQEFIAYGLTNERISNKLAQAKLPAKDVKYKNFADKMIALVKNIFDLLFRQKSLNEALPLFSSILKGNTTFSKTTILQDLERLTYKLSNADYKAANSLFVQKMKPLEGLLDTARKVVKTSNEYLSSGINYIATIADNTSWNNVSKYARTIGATKWDEIKVVGSSLALFAFSAQRRKLLKSWLADVVGCCQQGIIMSVLRDVTDPDAQSQRLELMAMNFRTADTACKEYEAIVYNELSEKFGDVKLNQLQETSLTDIGLRRDLHCLLDGTTTIHDVINYVADDKARQEAIDKYDAILQSHPNYSWIITQVRGLAWFMHTGQGNEHQNLNAANIAQGVLRTKSKTKFVVASDEQQAAIDKLATLIALDLANKDQRAVFASLKPEGIKYFLDTHKKFVEDSVNGVKLDDGRVVQVLDQIHAIKGYTKALFDTSYEVTTGFASDRKMFEDQGYTLMGMLPENKITGTTGIAYYRREYATPMRRDGAAVKITGAHSIGTTLRDSAYQLVGTVQNQGKVVNAPQLFDMFKDRANKRAAKLQAISDKKALSMEQIAKLSGGYVPIVGPTTGGPVDYRVTMSNDHKLNMLGMDTRGITILSKMFASQLMKTKAPTINKAITQFLIDNMNNNMDQYNRDINTRSKYIKLDKTTTNKYLKESWNVIPKEMLAAASKLPDGLWIREDWLQDLFGVQNYSITEAMPKDSLHNTRRALGIAEMVVKLVSFIAKQNIVVRVPNVLLGNAMSNLAYHIMNGTNPVTAVSLTLSNLRAMRDYMDTKKTLNRIKFRERIGTATTEEINSKNWLQSKLEHNRVHPLMQKGMYQSIIEDLNPEEMESTNKLVKALKNSKISKLTPGPVKWMLKQLYMTEGTPIYNFMFTLTQYSDFVARATEYQAQLREIEKETPRFLKNGRENPLWRNKEEDLSMMILRAFINYDKPQSRAEQYANDTGLLMFTKFAKRIQSIVVHQATKNPIGVILFLIGQSMLVDVEDIMEQNVFNKHWSALFHNPVENLFNAAIPMPLQYAFGLRHF